MISLEKVILGLILVATSFGISPNAFAQPTLDTLIIGTVKELQEIREKFYPGLNDAQWKLVSDPYVDIARNVWLRTRPADQVDEAIRDVRTKVASPQKFLMGSVSSSSQPQIKTETAIIRRSPIAPEPLDGVHQPDLDSLVKSTTKSLQEIREDIFPKYTDAQWKEIADPHIEIARKVWLPTRSSDQVDAAIKVVRARVAHSRPLIEAKTTNPNFGTNAARAALPAKTLDGTKTSGAVASKKEGISPEDIDLTPVKAEGLSPAEIAQLKEVALKAGNISEKEAAAGVFENLLKLGKIKLMEIKLPTKTGGTVGVVVALGAAYLEVYEKCKTERAQTGHCSLKTMTKGAGKSLAYFGLGIAVTEALALVGAGAFVTGAAGTVVMAAPAFYVALYKWFGTFKGTVAGLEILCHPTDPSADIPASCFGYGNSGDHSDEILARDLVFEKYDSCITSYPKSIDYCLKWVDGSGKYRQTLLATFSEGGAQTSSAQPTTAVR